MPVIAQMCVLSTRKHQYCLGWFVTAIVYPPSALCLRFDDWEPECTVLQTNCILPRQPDKGATRQLNGKIFNPEVGVVVVAICASYRVRQKFEAVFLVKKFYFDFVARCLCISYLQLLNTYFLGTRYLIFPENCVVSIKSFVWVSGKN